MSTQFIPYQRLELKSMSTEKIISIIRIATTNYPDTFLILTPRIDQTGQAYYWTGLRYSGCTELDFILQLNREIEAFILCFLIKGKDGLVDDHYQKQIHPEQILRWKGMAERCPPVSR